MKVKKFLAVLLSVLALTAGAVFMAACKPDLPDNSAGVTVTLIVLDLDKTELYKKELETTKSSLYEVFNDFEELQVDSTSSFTGAFINGVAIGKIEENNFGPYFAEEKRIEGNFSDSTFIAVYHDLADESLRDTSGFYDIQYAGKTFYSSNKGVSQLPLIDGATYVLKLASYA